MTDFDHCHFVEGCLLNCLLQRKENSSKTVILKQRFKFEVVVKFETFGSIDRILLQRPCM